MQDGNHVLILIVVDDGLVRSAISRFLKTAIGLNPYCSGRRSRTMATDPTNQQFEEVLILIVVDDGLVH